MYYVPKSGYWQYWEKTGLSRGHRKQERVMMVPDGCQMHASWLMARCLLEDCANRLNRAPHRIRIIIIIATAELR